MVFIQTHKALLFRHGRAALIALMVAMGLAFTAASAQAAIRYVKLDGVNGGPCNSPAAACASISDAIAAADPGDEIWVAAGLYTEAEIVVSKRLTMTGGFNSTLWGTSNYTFTPTILDGEGSHRVLQVTANNVFVQHFVVQNGNANTASAAAHFGGGILVVSVTDVTLSGLRVINNVASNADPNSGGGGIGQVGPSSLTIERSLILSNTTPALGGGIAMRPAAAQQALLTIESSVIAHNAAAEGGAIATLGNGRSVLTLNNGTLAHNNKGASPQAILMTGGNVVGLGNALNATNTLLMGNNTGFEADTTLQTVFLSQGFMMDDVTVDYTGNHSAGGDAPMRDLTFVNAPAGDYHLVAASPAIDIAGNSPRVDLEGRKRTTTYGSNCTPSSLCPLGRAEDYGAYEYVHTAPSIFYVAMEGNDSSNNCLDSDLPCKTLEVAAELTLGGDEIRLARGTYTDIDSNCGNTAIVCVTQGITLTGGFTLTNWNTPSGNPLHTVLDGSDSIRGIQVEYNAPTGNALIRNFTVRNGSALGSGGGIAVNLSNTNPGHNLTLRNCRVENNKAGDGDGGGIYAKDTVNFRVENCTIANNYVRDGRGGGIAVTDDNEDGTYTLTNLKVFSNLADRPDEMSANGGMGGGVFLQGKGTLQQSEVYSNTAAASGGGVTTGSNGAHPTVDRVYIHDNQASIGGGFSIFVTGGANLQNSLLVRNVATATVGILTQQTGDPMLGGNAIHSPYIGLPSEPLSVTNVTIADNVGAVSEAIKIEGSASVGDSRINNFTNVLISGSPVGIRSDNKGVINLNRVMMINNVITQTDNVNDSRLTGNPLTGVIGFAGPGDYHLPPGADGVDDGIAVEGITQDLDGITRPIGNAYDIGAYETTAQKQNQTITFPPIANRALEESPFTVSPSASSFLPVQLKTTTGSVCTVSGNVITLLSEGTCAIEAEQPGNPTFNPATKVTRSFKVGITTPQQNLLLPALGNNEP